MYTYPALLQLINQKITETSFGSNPKELYEPITYMMGLGGKRLRPVLTLMAADMFAADVNKALDAALAIEVFHNFTLVHDDIMDNAPLRRGKETVFQKWNMPVAILSGDLMLIRSIDLLAKTETNQFSKLLSVFNDTAAKVCEGQQIDMNFETLSKVTHDEYIHMISLKTAVLLGASLEIGARIAGASEVDAMHMYEFGKCIGIAFQIQDDILDSFGQTAAVGKRIGGDIASNKKTLLLIELLDSVHKDDLKLLQNLLAEPNDELKIEGVLALYDKYQIKAFAESQKQQYLDTAFHHLNEVSVSPERKQLLINTAHELMERVS
ncbi:MAG: polyprenyl synthetase family protein [Bacteroidota bacterium]|nr:polyprenyl synthetase family protein [Bacteroidota bacterium]